jgi:hypothetical protein
MSAKGMRVDGDVKITNNKERRVVVGNGAAQVELVGAAHCEVRVVVGRKSWCDFFAIAILKT